MMYVTCSDPEIELEFYPLYTLDNEEIEGAKRSTTVTVETNNDSGNEDDDSSNEESNNEDDDNDDINENSYTSLGSTANCYIVSKSGSYKFQTVKGNSSTSVGTVSKAEVLWESFGTSTKPVVGDLIKSAIYKEGYIYFKTADTFKEGNAVIAVKDASGTILWSWHIWLTDQPQGQTYYNNAGTMMDRNLGATSANPGDVGALGLLYQWGRKDPFLGSSSISTAVMAKSTITWPSPVLSNVTTGTVDYATSHPTTFIHTTEFLSESDSEYDWHYSHRDNTLWSIEKTMYDPCPAGWKVPETVWATALGLGYDSFTDASLCDKNNIGLIFSGKLGNSYTIWYPAAGCRSNEDGSLCSTGREAVFFSYSTIYELALGFTMDIYGHVFPKGGGVRSNGYSVRCLKE